MAKYPTVNLRASGLVMDPPPMAVEPTHYTNGRNIKFRDGAAEAIGADLQVFGTPLKAPQFTMGLQSVRSGLYWWMYFGQSGAGATDGVVHYDITPAGWTTPPTRAFPAPFGLMPISQMTGTDLNGVPCFALPHMTPVYWDFDITHDLLPLPGLPTGDRCMAMRAFKNFLVGVNWSIGGVGYPFQVRWSESAPPGFVPGSWTPIPSNDAGSRECADTDGPLIDAVPLGDAMLLYKQAAMYALTYIKGPLVMNLRTVNRHAGVIAPNCVAEVLGRHIVFGASDIYQTDAGGAVQSICEGRMRRWIYRQIDPLWADACYVVNNKAASEVWFCFSTSAGVNPTLAAVWYWPTDDWSVRDLNAWPYIAVGRVGLEAAGEVLTWNPDSGKWNLDSLPWNRRNFTSTLEQPLACQPQTPALIAADVPPAAGASPKQSTLVRETVPITGGEDLCSVVAVWPKMQGLVPGVQVQFQLGLQEKVNDAITWLPAQPFNIDTDLKIDAGLPLEARYWSLQLQAQVVGAWRFVGADIEHKLAGRY
jgi:hypothetical protein